MIPNVLAYKFIPGGSSLIQLECTDDACNETMHDKFLLSRMLGIKELFSI